MWHFRAELEDGSLEFKDWAAASTINVLLSSSNTGWKQLSKEEEKHFALTGAAEGGEEAGEVCSLVPLILLSVAAQQLLNQAWKKRLCSPHSPPQKLNPVLLWKQELLAQRTRLPDIGDRLRYLTHCNRNGHTTLCSQSQKGMMILRNQDYAEQGSRSWFFSVLHLEFIYSG